jgi:RNA polymerase sigma-70 factor, ECF subfamily
MVDESAAMKSLGPCDVTEILQHVVPGERAAAEQLFSAVYDELRKMAAGLLRRERSDHTLQPTALVHEAFLKLVDQTRVDWRGRAHFLAVAAQAMRRILVDHARRHAASKRGGHRHRIALEELALEAKREEDVLVVEDVLLRLTQLDPHQARMVELRFYGGLSVAETAEVQGVSKRAAEREWTMVRAWLRRELSGSSAA